MKNKNVSINIKTLSDFINLYEHATKSIKIFKDLLGDCDKATQDLLHALELGTSDKNKIATKLKTVRRDRRYYKDTLRQYEIISQVKDNNQISLNILKNSLGELKKLDKRIEGRRYKPRVIKEEIYERNVQDGRV